MTAALDTLHQDCFLHLTTFLDEGDVLALGATCKNLQTRINEDKRIWTALASRRFGHVKSVNRNWYRLARDPGCLSLTKVKELKELGDVSKKFSANVLEFCTCGSYAFALSKVKISKPPQLTSLSLTDQTWCNHIQWQRASGLRGGTVNGKVAVSFIGDKKTQTFYASIPVASIGTFVEGPAVPKNLPAVKSVDGCKLIGQGVVYMDYQYGTAQLWQDKEGRFTLTRAILTLDSSTAVDLD
jgi:hypothetical protein